MKKKKRAKPIFAKMILMFSTITFMIVNFVSENPLIKQHWDINIKTPLQCHKRSAIAIGSKSSPRTGYAGVISSDQEKRHKKAQKCLKWEKEHITGRWKCIKFDWSKQRKTNSYE